MSTQPETKETVLVRASALARVESDYVDLWKAISDARIALFNGDSVKALSILGEAQVSCSPPSLYSYSLEEGACPPSGV